MKVATIRRCVLLVATLACGEADATRRAKRDATLHPCIAWQLRELTRCATVTVPENRAIRGGRTIPLRVMVLPSRGTRLYRDPLVLLTGGPGMAATAMPGYADGVFGPLRDGRDVVLIDVRGTGDSSPLECGLYEDDGRLQRFVDPSFPLGPVRACEARLAAAADLTQYSTPILAQDLDDARAALGLDSLNLFGVSYGSRLALAYMRAFPAHVRSGVLQGITPPESEVFQSTPLAAERAVAHGLQTCARDEFCHVASPDPRADVMTLLAHLRERRATVRL